MTRGVTLRRPRRRSSSCSSSSAPICSVGRTLESGPAEASAHDRGHRASVVVGGRATPTRRAHGRFTTANEIHVPVGEPVLFVLEAHDVIHSFWVPNLAGKKDLIPGYTQSLWFQADTAGLYRGQCAEFCGAAAREDGAAGRRRAAREVRASGRRSSGSPPTNADRSVGEAADARCSSPARARCATPSKARPPARTPDPTSRTSRAAARSPPARCRTRAARSPAGSSIRSGSSRARTCRRTSSKPQDLDALLTYLQSLK